MKHGATSREKVQGTPGLYQRFTASGEARYEYQWRDAGGKLKKVTLAASNLRHARKEAIVLHGQAVVSREQARGLVRDPRRDRGIVLPGTEKGLVYIGAWSGDIVKIGWTRRLDINKRLGEVGCDLIACFPGGKTDEARLHHRFDTCRLSGHSEYFRAEGVLREWLETLLGPLRYDLSRYGTSTAPPREEGLGA